MVSLSEPPEINNILSYFLKRVFRFGLLDPEGNHDKVLKSDEFTEIRDTNSKESQYRLRLLKSSLTSL